MPHRSIRRSLAPVVPLLLVLAMPVAADGTMATQAALQATARCFPETGQCISGRFREFWEQHGGLAIFGLPITAPQHERNRDTGQTYLTQWFERNRFELHPENQPPYDVLIGRLGDDRLLQQGRRWQDAPRQTEQADCLWVAETGHTICDQEAASGFKTYWETHGLDLDYPGTNWRESVALFGLPLTTPQLETNSSGDRVLTQWFERARFEYHPHNPPQFRVLLGLLGNETSGSNAGAAPERPQPESVKLGVEEVARGLQQPLFVTHARDGTGRRFVVEKGGTIKIIPAGDVFLDIGSRVRSTGGEQGLLGLAFHPRFRENGYFYVNYIDTNGNTVISRFGLNANKQTGDPRSEQILLRQAQPGANHNGGMLAFGPDGYLYIGLGDGGGANDTYRNGQSHGTLLGKLLRIDVDRGTPYGIPADNPFVNDPTARAEIWAIGLRNPWRFSFDRANGDLYIADVGQGRSEWVHYGPQGQAGGINYGWPIVEGTSCLGAATCNRAGLATPIAEYNHSQGCAITGGYVYRGADYPALKGTYIFGDFCSGRIWTLRRAGAGKWQMTEALKTALAISSFGEDEQGAIYITDLAGGRVYRLTAAQ